jgi:cellulose synthase/poly-beta-1,6-N-acetylglucosamine synthase-like glycosyltransferase
MIVLQSARWLLLLAEVCLACPIAYLCLLSILAVIAATKKKYGKVRHDVQTTVRTRFAVLIPAHNEEALLDGLLESLSQLAYPKDLYTVYVVADNCSDGTAELARRFEGVSVYERFDAEKRGKGHALHWMWQQLEEHGLVYDAYLILDADSVVVPVFLQAMDRELVQGVRALQACNTVLNVADSPSTALRWIALTLVNHVRPLGRNALGGSSTLTGNGMCLSRALLLRHPWRAFGIAEDYQYYLGIVQDGETVRYLPEAIVRSHMPTTFHSMRTQDVRWEASAPQESRFRIALRLLGTGLRQRSFIRVEAAAELLVPPLSLLVSASLLLLVASVALAFLPGILASFILLGGLAWYIATPFALLRPPHAVYSALLHAPGFMLWKLWVYFVLSRSRKHTSEWVRTHRHPSWR